MCSTLHELARKGDSAALERALQQAESNVNSVDVDGNSALHVAVEATRNEEATLLCLMEHNADINIRNHIGAAPLHYVAFRKSNYKGVAKLLLGKKADVNASTVNGKTPLHVACEHGNASLVEMLCQSGADVSLSDTDGNTSVHRTMLQEGQRDSVKQQVLQVLASQSADMHAVNTEGLVPLHIASRAGQMRCMQFLLQSHADYMVLTARGETCLHLAALSGSQDCLQLLLHMDGWHTEAGVLAVDIADCQGNTALHCCAMTGNLECALLLLNKNADPNIANHDGRTPLQLSQLRDRADLMSCHNAELVQVLNDARSQASCTLS